MDRAFLILPDTEGPPAPIRASKLTPEKRDRYKRLRAVYSCVCGAALVPVLPQFKAQGGMVPRTKHFRSKTRDSHDLNCPWLQDEEPRSKFDGVPNFDTAVRAGAYVVLNLNSSPRLPYRSGRLATLGLPVDAPDSATILPQLNGRYVTLAVNDGKTFVRALHRVAELTGDLGRVLVSHGGGLRPVTEMIDDVSLGKGAHLEIEAFRLDQAMQKKRDQAANKREREQYAFAALFPRLMRIVPSKNQILSQFAPEAAAPYPKILPEIRGAARRLAIAQDQNSTVSKTVIFQHSLRCPDDEEQRRLLSHLAQGDAVYALVVPRVKPGCLRSRDNITFFDYPLEVIKGMTHIGPLPDRVQKALAAPFDRQASSPAAACATPRL